MLSWKIKWRRKKVKHLLQSIVYDKILARLSYQISKSDDYIRPAIKRL